jgi:hypothetical protein
MRNKMGLHAITFYVTLHKRLKPGQLGKEKKRYLDWKERIKKFTYVMICDTDNPREE